jgi:hypothetical protein
MPSHVKRIIRVATSVALIVLTLAGFAVAGVGRSTSQSRLPTTGRIVTDATPARPSSSSSRLVVAVALGASDTVGSDVLAPYEVFASSPLFSVYTVAASAAPAPISGGPAVVPTYTFADVASGRARKPDVVVVPAVDDPVGLNLAVPWLRPTLGVALVDGIGEINVASAFEVYSVSYAARTVAIATGNPVTTEHGVVLATMPAEDAPRLDRVVVPGATDKNAIDSQLRDWADKHDLPVDAMHGPGADVGFDGALEYLSATAGPATAVSAAKMIDYPTTNLDLRDGAAGPRAPLLVLLGLLVAGGLGCLPAVARKARHR